jgi:glyoxylase-like metal-dependent hydrolase (beta-lactamase superfamily II)
VPDTAPVAAVTEPVPEGVALVRATNSGPLSLTGTNTWIVGEPAWVIDPGPAEAGHVAGVIAEAERRGGVAGIAITHAHLDHAEAVPELRRRFDAPVAAGSRQSAVGREFEEPFMERLSPDVVLHDGDTFGPLSVIATPGHSLDHVSFVAGRVLFCGDTVLGEGSVFIAPGGNALALYLQSLLRLRALDDIQALCPGHGPVVWDAAGKLDEYIAHRLDRENRLLDALGRGLRSHDELLDDVWDDAPAVLRPAAMLTLEAHLEKLKGEGRLPEP